MRPARRAGGDRARQRLQRDRRGGHRARGADARHLRKIRHASGRAVEPRRGRSASQDVPHRQRRLRRAGSAGRPHLRGLAFRRHDRHVPVARQGARHSTSRAWSRSATRSICRSARSAPRRSTIPASTATCCFSKPCARPTRCAPSRSKPPGAASRCWPTSSGARPPRANWRCRTPARSPARTTSPACSSPNAASPASTRWRD